MKTEAQLAAQREVLLSVAAARQDLAQGKIHHALTGALQAINAAHIEQNSEDHTLRSAAHAALRSVLGETADLRRLFIAEDEVFQAVAFLPGRSEPVVAFAGSGGKTYLAGLEKPFSQTLDTCGAGLVTALAFDPRGQWLAAACADGSLSLWSSTNWQLLGRKHVLDKKIWTLAFSRDSRLVAAGGYENQVMLIAVGDDGRPQEPAPLANGDMPAGYVWSLVFSPRNDTLLVGDGVGRVLSCTAPVRESWTCGVSRAYRIAESTADAIRAIEFSPDGASVAVGLWTGRVKVSDAWDLATQSPIPIDVSQEPGPVHSLTSFEKDGCRYLAIGKGTRLLYRSMVGPEQQARADFDACIGRLNASVGDEVYSMAFHGPSGLLAAATRGGYVAILDPARRTMQSRALVPMPLKMGNPVRGAIVAEEGATTRLAVTLEPTEPENFNLALLTLRDGLLADSSGVLPLAAGSGKIRRVSGSAQSRRLATLTPGSDTLPTPPVVTVWRFDQDFKGVTPVLSLGTDDFDGLTPRRIALSPDGQRLVVAFEPPGEQTADEFQRERARKLLLVAVGADGGKTWLDTNLQSVREIAFSADGTLFAAGGGAQQGSDADEVKLWSVDSHGIEPTKLPPMVLSPSVYKVYDLAFAADPENVPLLVAGGDYGQIDIWSALTGNKIKTLRADSRPIYQLAFSSGGSLLAAADNQNVIRIWDTSQWTLMQLTPPTDPFETPGFLAFGRNGAWLMSGARALQLWDLDIDSLRHKACALLREPGQHGADMPTPMWRKNGCDAP